MLTDMALKSLKSREKTGKVADRDGMYAIVNKGGTVTFRYDYRFNGRRETLTLGKYGADGITLSEARELCMLARKKVIAGVSPAVEKARAKKAHREEDQFDAVATRYLMTARMAESTRSMRKGIYDRNIGPVWRKRLVSELTSTDLRNLCMDIKGRGAPATALLARDIVKQIFNFEKLHGRKIENIAEDVNPASIEVLQPRDRFLSPEEVRIAFDLIQDVATYPTLRLGLKFVLLTMVRKSELVDATWDEVNFETATWTIPKTRMKRSRPHNVYLSRQSLEILVALKACSGNSPYLLPSRYEADQPISRATFNRITARISELAKERGRSLEPFTVHDLRRTGATLLNELGFNSDWIEKALAHENRHTTRGVYNKAEYEKQRRHMLQEWANCVDAWIQGGRYADHYTGLLEVLGLCPADEFYTFNILEDLSNPARLRKLAAAYDEARKRSDSQEFKRHTEEFVRLLAFAWQTYGKTKRWHQPNGMMNQVFPKGFADQNCSVHMILPPPRVKGGFYTALDTNSAQVVESSKENELSLAFLIKYGSARIVLGGDATHENWALHRVKTNPGNQDTRFGVANLGAVAAKLPHHGSSIDCSEEVIDYIYMPRPAGERRRVAVISADGKSHPSPQTLGWLENRDIGPYCTNLAVQCGGTVHNLKMTPGFDPALSRFIATNSEPTRNAMTPCQGHVHLHFDDDGNANVTTQNNAFCAYRNKALVGI